VRTDLDTVARELRVEAHRLAAWREEFIAGGAEALKARPADPTDEDQGVPECGVGQVLGRLYRGRDGLTVPKSGGKTGSGRCRVVGGWHTQGDRVDVRRD